MTGTTRRSSVRPRRYIAPAGAAAVCVLALVACSPDPADFQQAAENYILSRDFSQAAGLLRFDTVDCVEPEVTEVDARFTCTATDEEGNTYLFNVEITDDTALQVLVPPTSLLSGPLLGTESTVPAGPTTTRPATTTTRPSGATTTTRPGTTVAATTTRPATTTTTTA